MKWLAASLLVVVLALQYRLWMSGDGVRELARLSEAVERQKAENAELRGAQSADGRGSRGPQGRHDGHRRTRAQ